MQQASEQNKLLHLSIAGIKEQLLEGNRYIEEAISDIKEEDATHTERLLNIAASLQVNWHGICIIQSRDWNSHQLFASGEQNV